MNIVTLENYKEILGSDESSYNWYWISSHQKLSEEVIEKFKDTGYWEGISYYQNLSDDFIKEFEYKLDLENLVESSVFHCGEENRCIHINKSDLSKIIIGCFEGTQEEAIEAVTEKYDDTIARDKYISQINECFNF